MRAKRRTKHGRLIFRAVIMGMSAMTIAIGARAGEHTLDAALDRLIQLVAGCIGFYIALKMGER